MVETYICENCHGVFPKTRADKEVSAEKDRLFPDEVEFAILCDECFDVVMT